jgi:hypothetical protein
MNELLISLGIENPKEFVQQMNIKSFNKIKNELKAQSATYLIIDGMTQMRERLSPFEILNRCLSENGKRRYLIQGIDFTIEPKSSVSKMETTQEESPLPTPEKKKRNIIKTQ